ncbi:hypothetical protein [Pseudomonas sp. M30-35]|uniref:GapS1 family protein n=1 Tax=Pseudomonas sp. M30-35 TaxID=1981174 RepID=UPI000B3CFEBF|nr:hypothetical protein [Pseudomonas sp. M30-35]ARU88275.1 hypothetical protein B9K09_10010 [Pseudomonas sp. M30-35]
MSEKQYQEKLKSVRSSLSCFTQKSIFEAAARQLQGKSSNNIDFVKKMPWIAMFIVKQSLLGNEGPRIVSDIEFYNIANDVYKMQLSASNLEEGSVDLKLRAMCMQQLWYQQNFTQGLLSIFRQSNFFSKKDSFYSQEFENDTGLSLRSFYIITLYLLVIVRSIKNSHIVEINLYSLIYNLCPKVPPNHIVSYLMLTTVKTEHLSIFMEKYRLDDSPQSEYFQETPFKHKPMILSGEILYVFNSSIFEVGITSLVPSRLKKNVPKFKNYFGKLFEGYINELLDSSGLEYWNEEQIKQFYKENSINGKVVDFLFFGNDGDIGLIECKAVEPNDIIKASFDPEILKKSLQNSFIGALEQGSACANLLSKTEKFKDAQFRLATITHEEHAIVSGQFVAEHIDTNLQERLNNNYRPSTLKLENALYLTIADFETLIAAQKSNTYDLNLFLKECSKDQLNPSTKRMMTKQFVDEKLPPRVYETTAIHEEMDSYLDELEIIFTSNKRYWQEKVNSLIESRLQLVDLLNKNLTPYL